MGLENIARREEVRGRSGGCEDKERDADRERLAKMHLLY